MYKAPEIAQFVRTHLREALPDFTAQYKRRDILRTRGNLVQWMFVGISRGGWLEISPALSVIGPHIHLKDSEHCKNKDGTFNSDGLIVSVGLSGMSASDIRRWSFPPETPLDTTFATEILARLKQDSPIPFTEPLKDDSIDNALRWFGKNGLHWTSNLFLAYFNMTRGAPSARKDLARAFELFRRNSRMVTGKPLRDWEEALLARFQELESRLDRPDCIALCRADAEEHARLLKLPPIVWPPEWPESVPPWPKEPDSLIAKLGGFLTRKP